MAEATVSDVRTVERQLLKVSKIAEVRGDLVDIGPVRDGRFDEPLLAIELKVLVVAAQIMNRRNNSVFLVPHWSSRAIAVSCVALSMESVDDPSGAQIDQSSASPNIAIFSRGVQFRHQEIRKAVDRVEHRRKDDRLDHVGEHQVASDFIQELPGAVPSMALAGRPMHGGKAIYCLFRPPRSNFAASATNTTTNRATAPRQADLTGGIDLFLLRSLCSSAVSLRTLPTTLPCGSMSTCVRDRTRLRNRPTPGRMLCRQPAAHGGVRGVPPAPRETEYRGRSNIPCA